MNYLICPKCGSTEVEAVEWLQVSHIADETGLLSRAAGGAATGAAIGSVIPVAGPIVGAVGGALAGMIAGTMGSFKSEPEEESRNTGFSCRACGHCFLLEDDGGNGTDRASDQKTSETRYDVFISYKHEDIGSVRKVCKVLDAMHIQYWIDQSGVCGGVNYRERIAKIIRNVAVVLFFSSKRSNASENVRREICLADEAGKVIIPIMVDDSNFSDSISYTLAGVNRLELSDVAGIKVALKRALMK